MNSTKVVEKRGTEFPSFYRKSSFLMSRNSSLIIIIIIFGNIKLETEGRRKLFALSVSSLKGRVTTGRGCIKTWQGYPRDSPGNGEGATDEKKGGY